MQARVNFASVDGSLYGNYCGHLNLQSRAAAIFLDLGLSSGHFPNGNLFFGVRFRKFSRLRRERIAYGGTSCLPQSARRLRRLWFLLLT